MRTLIAAFCLVSIPAFADTAFAPIPSEQTGGKASGLEMRVVNYNGSTNGEIEVEVKNPTGKAVEFSAKGIYFVPNGNPDSAPQRVGAVGPFRMKTADGWQPKQQASLAANSTVRMKLDVYCIDSHRGSPSSSTSFRMGSGRLPRPMVQSIDHDAMEASKSVGGVAAPSAKSAVQSEVWKNRDKKWIRLDGEGRQEMGK